MSVQTVGVPVYVQDGHESLTNDLTTVVTASPDIAASYDGSNIVFRLLRLDTWGPTLMNLGYYRWTGPLSFLNLFGSMERSQRELVLNAAKLLQVQSQHEVLDVACGRGKSSFMLSCLQPDATVIGLDLLDENVQVASTLFGEVDGLSYLAGTAMDLRFSDESFDRVVCIEAAFHFPDRARFLREAWRSLRPGGRLVVIDFAWNSASDRIHLEDPETRLVRDVWKWDDFFTVDEYEDAARAAGFVVTSVANWTSRVTRPMQGMFRFLAFMGRSALGRKLLRLHNPLYGSVSVADWANALRAVRAHEHVQRHSRYMAFVFDKPEMTP